MTKQEMIDKYGEEAYRRHAERTRARGNERYNNDPEFRERHKASVCANFVERYKKDSEFREKQKARSSNYCKERYNNDHEFRERVNTRCNAYNKERYCSESLEAIENYQSAKADDFEGWDLHHRLEINEHGKVRFTMKQLKKLDLYYNRPASELIWLTRKEHRRMHAISRRKDV